MLLQGSVIDRVAADGMHMVGAEMVAMPVAGTYRVEVTAEDGIVRLADLARLWQRAKHDDLTHLYRGVRFPAEVIKHAVWLYQPSLNWHKARQR